jgi:hypothetical protein
LPNGSTSTRTKSKTWSRPGSSIRRCVTRSALQNAASIAKSILTTEAIVAEPPEMAGAGMAGGMGDMGGMM